MAIAAGAGIAGLAYYIYSNQDEQTNKIADTKKGHDKKIRSKFNQKSYIQRIKLNCVLRKSAGNFKRYSKRSAIPFGRRWYS